MQGAPPLLSRACFLPEFLGKLVGRVEGPRKDPLLVWLCLQLPFPCPKSLPSPFAQPF